MKDLKEKTIRGGFARMCAQAANFLLRLGSLMVLARLLGPKDFGLVGMVTAFTGVLTLFRDFGLSSAAIQRATVTEEQSSTLFWINIDWCVTRAAVSGIGTGHCGLLSRAPISWRDDGFGGWIPLQRSRSATQRPSATPNALYGLSGDKHHWIVAPRLPLAELWPATDIGRWWQ